MTSNAPVKFISILAVTLGMLAALMLLLGGAMLMFEGGDALKALIPFAVVMTSALALRMTENVSRGQPQFSFKKTSDAIVATSVIAGLAIFLTGAWAGKMRGEARSRNADRMKMMELGTSIKLYFVECGEFPELENMRVALQEKNSKCPSWEPVKPELLENRWGKPLEFKQSENGIVIVSLGRDGQSGGTGEDQDREWEVKK